MLSYCLKCKKNMKSKNPEVVKTKNRRIMLLPKYVACNSKKSRFLKEKEARELLSSLRIGTPLSRTLLGPPLF